MNYAVLSARPVIELDRRPNRGWAQGAFIQTLAGLLLLVAPAFLLAAENAAQYALMSNWSRPDDILRIYISPDYLSSDPEDPNAPWNPANLNEDPRPVTIEFVETELRVAAAYWTNITGARIEVVYAGISQSDCTNRTDGIYMICFIPDTTQVCNAGGNIAGCALSGIAGDGLIWIRLRKSGIHALLLAHEIGHVLGFDHIADGIDASGMQTQSVMGFGGFAGVFQSGLALPGDRAGARYLYPEPKLTYGNGIVEVPCVLHGPLKQPYQATIQHSKDGQGNQGLQLLQVSRRAPPLFTEACSRFNGNDLNLVVDVGGGVVVEVETTLQGEQLLFNSFSVVQ